MGLKLPRKEPEAVVRFVRVARAFVASVFTYVLTEIYLAFGRAFATLPDFLRTLSEAECHRLANLLAAAVFAFAVVVPSLRSDLKQWRELGGRPIRLLTILELGFIAIVLRPAFGSQAPGAAVEQTVGIFKHAANSVLPLMVASLIYILLPTLQLSVGILVVLIRGRMSHRAEGSMENE
ncbi:MAG: hypothetical protein U0136_03055 [Bdellovibrionota bacterium]